jgi:hypothetical protein
VVHTGEAVEALEVAEESVVEELEGGKVTVLRTVRCTVFVSVVSTAWFTNAVKIATSKLLALGTTGYGTSGRRTTEDSLAAGNTRVEAEGEQRGATTRDLCDLRE